MLQRLNTSRFWVKGTSCTFSFYFYCPLDFYLQNKNILDNVKFLWIEKEKHLHLILLSAETKMKLYLKIMNLKKRNVTNKWFITDHVRI